MNVLEGLSFVPPNLPTSFVRIIDDLQMLPTFEIFFTAQKMKFLIKDLFSKCEEGSSLQYLLLAQFDKSIIF